MRSFYKEKLIKVFYKGRKVKQHLNFESKFELNLNEYNLGINEEFKLRPKIETKATLEWLSDNESVAVVDNKGNITPISLGICNIICKKGNSIAKCKLTIEEEETIDMHLDSCKMQLEIVDNNIVQFNNGFEGEPEVSEVQIINNKMVFTGASFIETNGVKKAYGFGTASTLKTQRILIRFKINEYPTGDEQSYLIYLKKISSGTTGMDSKVRLTTDGHLIIGNNDTNISSFVLPKNKWIDLVVCVGTVSNIGWSAQFKYGDTVDEFWGTGSSVWGTDITLGKGFKGEVEFCGIYYSNAVESPNKIDAFDNDIYKAIDDYVFNKKFNSISATIEYGHYGRIRNMLDYNISEPLNLTYKLHDLNALQNMIFINNDKFTYDLEELDEYGYIIRIYKNVLKYGEQTIELVNDYDTPQRWYKHLRLRDNFKKTYIKDKDLGISTVDPTITNNNDGVPSYFHISPKVISSRVGKYVLIQPTFAPFNQYKDPRCEWKSSDESIATVDESGLVTCKAVGECIITAKSFANPALKAATATIVVKEPIDESKFPVLDLERYNIQPHSEDYEICFNNVENISAALLDYVSQGYEGVKLPTDTYNIKLQKTNTTTASITLPSDFTFDLNGSTLQALGDDISPDTYMVRLNYSDNSILKNGTLIGDLYTHDYGIRLNEDPGSAQEGFPNSVFELGCINHNDGITLVENSTIDGTVGVRTKDFIEITEYLAEGFAITPLWHTTMNTVDGGRAIVYWYDKDNNYISYIDKGFAVKHFIPPTGAAKFKIVFRSEQRLDPIFSINNLGLHASYEFGTGVNISNSFNAEIQNITSKNFMGDCMATSDFLGDRTAVNDLRVIDCTLENARRQGFSYVAPQDNCLMMRVNIGKINGVDPQCGVDFEAYARNEKYLFDECNFYDNRKWDMVDCYSGQIEIKNCKFNGTICLGQSSYNWYVHDCEFIYDDKYIDSQNYKISKYKIHNIAGANLPVNRNEYCYTIAENNIVDGKSVGRGILKTACGNAKNANARSKNNKVYNTQISCSGLSENDFVYGTRYINNDLGGLYINFHYENANPEQALAFNVRQKVSTYKDSTFKYITFGGIGYFENCNITCNNNPISGQSANDNGYLLHFKNCTIINEANMGIGSVLNGNIMFEDCDIYITRIQSQYLKYGPLMKYINCTFHFSADGPKNTIIDWLRYGYGIKCSNMYYENCKFIAEEGYPVRLNNSNYDDNCVAEGSFVLETKNKITDFNMSNITNDMQISSRNTNVKLGLTMDNITDTSTNKLFLDITPRTNQMNISYGDTIADTSIYVGYPTVGKYHLRFYTGDGSNLVKEYDIEII